jgi:hypothetical protein
MEAIIALVLSSLVIILVSTTFLVQNQYYSTQIQLTGVHNNVRAATELMASEIRSVMEDGIIVAGARTLTIRTPITIITACQTGNSRVSAHVQGGQPNMDTTEVGGVARRDAATGEWNYANTTWSAIYLGGGTPAALCAARGADTVGASADYYDFAHSGFSGLGSGPFDKDVLMIFRETTFTIKTSEMDPTTLGLFRTPYGGSAVEYVTGLASTAQFQYRTLGAYADTIVTPKLPFIDVVRVVADGERRAVTGGTAAIQYGWSVNIALRNVREN